MGKTLSLVKLDSYQMFCPANPHVCVLQYDEEGEEADDEVRLLMNENVWF